MPIPIPHIREAGTGPAVICLHSNASSSTQWRGLMDLLSPTHRVLAPDGYGSGKSPEWPSASEIRLQDEVDLLAPVLALAGSPCLLVAHSHGAAVALIAALKHPGQVRALVVYEPTLFSLVEAMGPSPNGVDGIRNAVAAAAEALDAGDPDGAAGFFIDFWMGAGSWAATPAPRKPAIVASIVNVRRWAHALMTEPTPLAAFAALDIPILYMVGGASPESARSVARVLLPVLPQARLVAFPGLGHMAPITHAEVVNAEIQRFIAAL